MPEHLSYIRSFIAVDVDDDKIGDNILQLQKRLQRTGADIKPVEKHNLHITLRFLGDILPSSLEEIQRTISSIQFEPFEMGFRDVGVFPSQRRINVIWVGIQQGSIELLHIYNQLEANLNKLGMKQDRKGWSPHMTIARVRSGRNRIPLLEEVNSLKNREIGAFYVTSFRLKKSVLTPKGPIYTTLHEIYAK